MTAGLAMMQFEHGRDDAEADEVVTLAEDAQPALSACSRINITHTSTMRP